MLDFQTIPGQNAIKRHFQAAVRSDRVSHAYILEGPAGMGRNALAVMFAGLLLCERGGPVPCGTCHACRQVLAGTHPDLIRVTHEKPKLIAVGEIREQLSAAAAIRPFSGKRRVFIVPDAEKMQPGAQNAALKTIEEPPDYAVIILITESAEALLETIRSRCVILKTRPVPDSEIIALLKGKGVPEETARLAAGFARGNPGQAEEMAASETFRAVCEANFRMFAELPEAGPERIAAEAARIRESYPDLHRFLDFVRMYMRDLLVILKERKPEGLSFPAEETEILRTARSMPLRRAGRILEETEHTADRLRANVNPGLCLEMLLYTMKGKDT